MLVRCMSIAPRSAPTRGLATPHEMGLYHRDLVLLDLTLRVPDHTTLSRRGRRLKLSRPARNGRGSLDIVMDSTGLGIHGPGEWRAEAHGGTARR